MTEWFDGFVSANGASIHYHRTGGADKPSIILLHGVTDNGLCWTRVARTLEDTYDVIMTDARGHGRSKGLEAGFSNQIMADDVAAVIRELGLQKPYLFGHSMGAMTSITVAATYPDLIRAAILEDPALVDGPRRSANAAPTDKHPWQWIFDLKALSLEDRMARGRADNPRWVEEEIVPWAESKGEFDIRVVDNINIYRKPWREVIAPITCPVLLITGDPELRAIVTPEVAQEAKQLKPNFEVVHIPGTGHNIRRDNYAATMSAVQTFLQNH